ncbi:MAG: DEAD/DEAH box helicase family protein [Aristaeellaceae bacterium]
MTGTKYLSEVVKLDALQKDHLNIINAPTGSGKTYFALTAIPATLTDAVHKVVYLIDTINGREQILKNYKARSIYRYWDVEVDGEALSFDDDERIVVITYAKFGILLEKYPDFHEHFEYIICDELHSLFKFAKFGPQPNSHSIAKHGIERAVRNDHTKVIALSATPERIKREFDAPHCDVPVDDSDLIQYATHQTIPYTNLEYLLTALDPSETGICYVSHISTMKAIEADARNLGLNPICIWSIRNADHTMSEEQLNVRKHLLNNFEIPAEYHLLIINASSETSLKIKSHIDYVIVHSGDRETQIQVRGRVNSDLSCLYLPSNDPTALTVPEDFLNRPLFTQDKAKLCEILNQNNEFGRQFKWTTIHKMLIDCNYCVTEGRKNSLRYAVITQADE